MYPSLNRRNFLKGSALLVGAYASRRAFGQDANSEIRIAIAGLNGRGKQLINDVMRTKGARLVALCDVDSEVLAKHAEAVLNNHQLALDTVADFRHLLERSDIDAVVIATPNHWHALQTIWALQAGKDVYVEKPVCHSIWEGHKIREAAAKYGRIVQGGLQNRSDIGLKEAFAYIHGGNLGKITQVRALCYKNRKGIGKRDTPLVPPRSVNYDLWLGPAADEPLYRDRLHYDWHWNWNTGNGDLGNQGVHELDLVRWVLGDPQDPQRAMSMGQRFAWNDAGASPNMQIAILDWGDKQAIFEMDDLTIDPDTNGASNYKGNRIGIIVTCEGGEFRGGRGGGIVYDENNKPRERFKGDGGFDHFPSFIRAVNSRKQSDLASPIEQAVKSTLTSHLCNIAYQTGRGRRPDIVAKTVSENPLLASSFERFEKHLDIWQVDRSEERWIVGNFLRFDSASQRFSGGSRAENANALLRRDAYRSGFQVPENV